MFHPIPESQMGLCTYCEGCPSAPVGGAKTTKCPTLRAAKRLCDNKLKGGSPGVIPDVAPGRFADAKLLPLLKGCMKVAQGKYNRAELKLLPAALKHVLAELKVCFAEVCLYSMQPPCT